MSDTLDMDVSSRRCESLTSALVEEVQLTISRLHDLWKEIGLPPTEQHDKLKTLKDTIRHFYSKEENEKDNLLRKVDEQGKELFNLSRELGVYSEEFFNDNGVSLIEMEERLRRNLQYLHSLVSERQTQRSALLRQEQELCEQLIEDPSEITGRDIPTLDELSHIQRRINTLEQEKVNRLRVVRGLKDDIKELLHELNQSSSSQFLNSFMNGKEELFTLSLHNIESLKRIKRELCQKAAKNQNELKDLISKVSHLWDRLDVDQTTRNDFLSALTNIVPNDIEVYRIELERLEELKMVNITRFISQLKTELEEWWDRCYVSDDDKHHCQAYFCDDNTEEVLTALEDEVKRLERVHEDAHVIYSLLDKRKSLWNLLMELEARSTDPSRLFGNRGGGLLKEEKERNRIKQELPRVELELKETVEHWEKEQSDASGGPVVFSVRGLSVMDYITQEWDHYHERRMMDAKERQSARTAQLQQEARLGSRPGTAKRRLNATQSLRGGRTAAANSTASTTGSSLHKNEASRSSATSSIRSRRALADRDTNVKLPPAAPVKGGAAGLVRRTSKRLRSAAEVEELETSKSKRRRGTDEPDSSQITTYSQFADSIALRSEAEQVRSSVLKSPLTPHHRPPLAPTQTVPRNLRLAGAAARRNHLPVTPKSKNNVNVSAAFATPAHTARSPVSAMRAPRTLPNRRRSQRFGNMTQSSRTGGSMLRLTTPAHNKLKFLI